MRTLTFTWIFIILPVLVMSQDTIAGWNFPTGVSSELIANHGTLVNKASAHILATDTLNGVMAITFTNGVTGGDYAATTSGWDNGDSNKYWQVDFIAVGYENLVVRSKQRSGNTNPGPKYYRLQYKIGTGVWTDISGSGLITLGNDWTTGVVSGQALPSACDNVSDTIYLRWLMITNESLSGSNVLSNGTTKIDDIYITGSLISTDIEVVNEDDDFLVYPTITSGKVNISCPTTGTLYIYNQSGQLVKSEQYSKEQYVLELEDQLDSLYFLYYISSDHQDFYKSKLILVH
jgi:hypothetical protein